MAGWCWWWLVVLVYEYIEGVFERNEDVFEKKGGNKKPEHWDVRLLG